MAQNDIEEISLSAAEIEDEFNDLENEMFVSRETPVTEPKKSKSKKKKRKSEKETRKHKKSSRDETYSSQIKSSPRKRKLLDVNQNKKNVSSKVVCPKRLKKTFSEDEGEIHSSDEFEEIESDNSNNCSKYTGYSYRASYPQPGTVQDALIYDPTYNTYTPARIPVECAKQYEEDFEYYDPVALPYRTGFPVGMRGGVYRPQAVMSPRRTLYTQSQQPYYSPHHGSQYTVIPQSSQVNMVERTETTQAFDLRQHTSRGMVPREMRSTDILRSPKRFIRVNDLQEPVSIKRPRLNRYEIADMKGHEIVDLEEFGVSAISKTKKSPANMVEFQTHKRDKVLNNSPKEHQSLYEACVKAKERNSPILFNEESRKAKTKSFVEKGNLTEDITQKTLKVRVSPDNKRQILVEPNTGSQTNTGSQPFRKAKPYQQKIATTLKKVKKKFFNIDDFRNGKIYLQCFLSKFKEQNDRSRTVVLYPVSRTQLSSPVMQQVIRGAHQFNVHFDDPYSIGQPCDIGLVSVSYQDAESYGLWLCGVKQQVLSLSTHIHVTQLDKQHSLNFYLKKLWSTKHYVNENNLEQRIAFLHNLPLCVTSSMLRKSVNEINTAGKAVYMLNISSAQYQHAMVLFDTTKAAQDFASMWQAKERWLFGQRVDAFLYGSGNHTETSIVKDACSQKLSETVSSEANGKSDENNQQEDNALVHDTPNNKLVQASSQNAQTQCTPKDNAKPQESTIVNKFSTPLCHDQTEGIMSSSDMDLSFGYDLETTKENAPSSPTPCVANVPKSDKTDNCTNSDNVFINGASSKTLTQINTQDTSCLIPRTEDTQSHDMPDSECHINPCIENQESTANNATNLIKEIDTTHENLEIQITSNSPQQEDDIVPPQQKPEALTTAEESLVTETSDSVEKDEHEKQPPTTDTVPTSDVFDDHESSPNPSESEPPSQKLCPHSSDNQSPPIAGLMSIQSQSTNKLSSPMTGQMADQISYEVSAASETMDSFPAKFCEASTIHAESIPAESIPAESIPAESIPAESIPAESIPAQSCDQDHQSQKSPNCSSPSIGEAISNNPAGTDNICESENFDDTIPNTDTIDSELNDSTNVIECVGKDYETSGEKKNGSVTEIVGKYLVKQLTNHRIKEVNLNVTTVEITPDLVTERVDSMYVSSNTENISPIKVGYVSRAVKDVGQILDTFLENISPVDNLNKKTHYDSRFTVGISDKTNQIESVRISKDNTTVTEETTEKENTEADLSNSSEESVDNSIVLTKNGITTENPSDIENENENDLQTSLAISGGLSNKTLIQGDLNILSQTNDDLVDNQTTLVHDTLNNTYADDACSEKSSQKAPVHDEGDIDLPSRTSVDDQSHRSALIPDTVQTEMPSTDPILNKQPNNNALVQDETNTLSSTSIVSDTDAFVLDVVPNSDNEIVDNIYVQDETNTLLSISIHSDNDGNVLEVVSISDNEIADHTHGQVGYGQNDIPNVSNGATDITTNQANHDTNSSTPKTAHSNVDNINSSSTQLQVPSVSAEINAISTVNSQKPKTTLCQFEDISDEEGDEIPNLSNRPILHDSPLRPTHSIEQSDIDPSRMRQHNTTVEINSEINEPQNIAAEDVEHVTPLEIQQTCYAHNVSFASHQQNEYERRSECSSPYVINIVPISDPTQIIQSPLPQSPEMPILSPQNPTIRTLQGVAKESQTDTKIDSKVECESEALPFGACESDPIQIVDFDLGFPLEVSNFNLELDIGSDTNLSTDSVQVKPDTSSPTKQSSDLIMERPTSHTRSHTFDVSSISSEDNNDSNDTITYNVDSDENGSMEESHTVTFEMDIRLSNETECRPIEKAAISDENFETNEPGTKLSNKANIQGVEEEQIANETPPISETNAASGQVSESTKTNCCEKTNKKATPVEKIAQVEKTAKKNHKHKYEKSTKVKPCSVKLTNIGSKLKTDEKFQNRRKSDKDKQEKSDATSTNSTCSSPDAENTMLNSDLAQSVQRAFTKYLELKNAGKQTSFPFEKNTPRKSSEKPAKKIASKRRRSSQDNSSYAKDSEATPSKKLKETNVTNKQISENDQPCKKQSQGKETQTQKVSDETPTSKSNSKTVKKPPKKAIFIKPLPRKINQRSDRSRSSDKEEDENYHTENGKESPQNKEKASSKNKLFRKMYQNAQSPEKHEKVALPTQNSLKKSALENEKTDCSNTTNSTRTESIDGSKRNAVINLKTAPALKSVQNSNETVNSEEEEKSTSSVTQKKSGSKELKSPTNTNTKQTPKIPSQFKGKIPKISKVNPTKMSTKQLQEEKDQNEFRSPLQEAPPVVKEKPTGQREKVERKASLKDSRQRKENFARNKSVSSDSDSYRSPTVEKRDNVEKHEVRDDPRTIPERIGTHSSQKERTYQSTDGKSRPRNDLRVNTEINKNHVPHRQRSSSSIVEKPKLNKGDPRMRSKANGSHLSHRERPFHTAVERHRSRDDPRLKSETDRNHLSRREKYRKNVEHNSKLPSRDKKTIDEPSLVPESEENEIDIIKDLQAKLLESMKTQHFTSVLHELAETVKQAAQVALQMENSQISPSVQMENSQISPPVQNENFQISPPVQMENSRISPSILMENSQISPPLQMENSQTSPPVQMKNSQINPPVQMENSQISPRVQMENSQISPPIQIENSQISPPVQMVNSQINPPVQMKNCLISPPVQNQLADKSAILKPVQSPPVLKIASQRSRESHKLEKDYDNQSRSYKNRRRPQNQVGQPIPSLLDLKIPKPGKLKGFAISNQNEEIGPGNNYMQYQEQSLNHPNNDIGHCDMTQRDEIYSKSDNVVVDGFQNATKRFPCLRVLHDVYGREQITATENGRQGNLIQVSAATTHSVNNHNALVKDLSTVDKCGPDGSLAPGTNKFNSHPYENKQYASPAAPVVIETKTFTDERNSSVSTIQETGDTLNAFDIRLFRKRKKIVARLFRQVKTQYATAPGYRERKLVELQKSLEELRNKGMQKPGTPHWAEDLEPEQSGIPHEAEDWDKLQKSGTPHWAEDLEPEQSGITHEAENWDKPQKSGTPHWAEDLEPEQSGIPHEAEDWDKPQELGTSHDAEVLDKPQKLGTSHDSEDLESQEPGIPNEVEDLVKPQKLGISHEDWGSQKSGMPHGADDWESQKSGIPYEAEIWDKPQKVEAPHEAEDWESQEPGIPYEAEDWDKPQKLGISHEAGDWEGPKSGISHESDDLEKPQKLGMPHEAADVKTQKLATPHASENEESVFSDEDHDNGTRDGLLNAYTKALQNLGKKLSKSDVARKTAECIQSSETIVNKEGTDETISTVISKNRDLYASTQQNNVNCVQISSSEPVAYSQSAERSTLMELKSPHFTSRSEEANEKIVAKTKPENVQMHGFCAQTMPNSSEVQKETKETTPNTKISLSNDKERVLEEHVGAVLGVVIKQSSEECVSNKTEIEVGDHKNELLAETEDEIADLAENLAIDTEPKHFTPETKDVRYRKGNDEPQPDKINQQCLVAHCKDNITDQFSSEKADSETKHVELACNGFDGSLCWDSETKHNLTCNESDTSLSSKHIECEEEVLETEYLGKSLIPEDIESLSSDLEQDLEEDLEEENQEEDQEEEEDSEDYIKEMVVFDDEIQSPDPSDNEEEEIDDSNYSSADSNSQNSCSNDSQSKAFSSTSAHDKEEQMLGICGLNEKDFIETIQGVDSILDSVFNS